MKTLRKMHLYLGCLSAPLLIFFAASGCWQMFDLHRSRKDGSYMAPAFVAKLSQIHTRQQASAKPSTASRWAWRGLILLMTVGVVTTAGFGVAMAFYHSGNPRLVWFCLGAGIGLPVLLP
jgi:hypothetical protein